MSNGLSWFVIILTLAYIFGNFGLLMWARSKRIAGAAQQSLGHEYDGIQELDTPLPRWWLWIFIGSIVFALVYLVLYPGLGNFPGVLGWTSSGQLRNEVAQADAQYGPLYAAYASKPIPELIKDPKAMEMGQRLFANNCAQCHGSDARGGVGFPNLTDNDWLWGGDPDTIQTTILAGRNGIMPPMAAVIGEENVPAVVAYVQSLSGMKVDSAKAAVGKEKFNTVCMACHGMDGKGNQALGAPNLTDDVWLFGNDPATIAEGIYKGRNLMMPAHQNILGDQKAHVVAAYVYGLSHKGGQ